jgi:hypothetical protein
MTGVDDSGEAHSGNSDKYASVCVCSGVMNSEYERVGLSLMNSE